MYQIGFILIWLCIGLTTAYFDAPVVIKVTKSYGFITGHRTRDILPVRFLIITIGGPVGVLVKAMWSFVRWKGRYRSASMMAPSELKKLRG